MIELQAILFTFSETTSVIPNYLKSTDTYIFKDLQSTALSLRIQSQQQKTFVNITALNMRKDDNFLVLMINNINFFNSDYI